jgi:hypothetical protein
MALCVLSLCCLALPPMQAQAQGLRSLKESMFGQPSQDGRESKTPKYAHFRTQNGEGFIMDASRDDVLVRFDNDNEIYALTPFMGPKGDIIFKNDVGESVLKVTRWGGFTLFTPKNPGGEAVAVTGTAEPFVPGHITPALLFQHLARASRQASQSANHLIPYDATVSTPGADYLFADAATVTTDAIISVAQNKNGGNLLAAVKEVRLIEGRPPSIKLIDGVLELKLDTRRGMWGGRPSSKRISKVIMSGFSLH